MTYMACGLSVVSTPKGAEGVGYVNGRDIIITDEEEKFADAVVRLLSDSDCREEIAKNGREFVLKNYDWNVIGKKDFILPLRVPEPEFIHLIISRMILIVVSPMVSISCFG